MKQLLMILLLAPTVIVAQKKTLSSSGLEWDTKKIMVIVEFLNEEAKRTGLTEDQIKTRCELRLRQIGLIPVEEYLPAYLYVNVNVVGKAFAISVRWNRQVRFSNESKEYTMSGAATWQKGGTGTHGGVSGTVMELLDVLLDSFLNEFLKANPSLGK